MPEWTVLLKLIPRNWHLLTAKMLTFSLFCLFHVKLKGIIEAIIPFYFHLYFHSSNLYAAEVSWI